MHSATRPEVTRPEVRQSRSIRLAQVMAAVLTAGVLSGAKSGCGSEEANETFTSPVQAVTTLLERADGTVEAQLVLISTAKNPHEFVDTVVDPVVRVPGGAQVELVSSTPGHYVATSTDDRALVYVPGETYQFRFELDDAAAARKVAGGHFVAVMDAPDDDVTATMATAPEFAGDTARLEWSPGARFGLIEVWRAADDTRVWANFDFAKPNFDGSKWARLKKGGHYDFGVDVFADAGDYIVKLCAIDKVSDFDTSLSAELGALSGFLIGRCAPDIELAVE